MAESKKGLIYGLQYTTIHHKLREKLGVTPYAYMIIDSIDKLSRHSKAPVKGWCTTSKQAIADFLEISKRTVDGHITELVSRGLLIRHPDKQDVPNGLRAFPEFYDLVEFEKTASREEREKLAQGVQDLHSVGKTCAGGCAMFAQ